LSTPELKGVSYGGLMKNGPRPVCAGAGWNFSPFSFFSFFVGNGGP